MNTDPHDDDKPPIDPRHPCQTPERSFPRHYWVSLLKDGKLDLLKQRCTTCGAIEDVMLDRWEGQ